jgi:hypothetical protein
MHRHFRISQTALAGLPSNRICEDTLHALAPRFRQAFFGAEEIDRLDQKVTENSPRETPRCSKVTGSITADFDTGKEG